MVHSAKEEMLVEDKDRKRIYKAVHNYRAKHYDRIEIIVPAGAKDKLKEFANASGAKSLQQWLMGLIEKETGLELVLRGELPYLKQSGNKENDDGAD